MGSSVFNITELLRVLGIRNVSDLPIAERIQPVLSVGELSGLTPAHVPPTVFCGGTTTAVGATRAFLAIQALGVGGSILAWLNWRVVAGNQIIYATFATDPTGGLGAAVNHYPASLVMGASRGQDGAQAGILNNLTDPHYTTATATISGPIYLPYGHWFYAESRNDTTTLTWSALIQDVPASEGQP